MRGGGLSKQGSHALAASGRHAAGDASGMPLGCAFGSLTCMCGSVVRLPRPQRRLGAADVLAAGASASQAPTWHSSGGVPVNRTAHIRQHITERRGVAIHLQPSVAAQGVTCRRPVDAQPPAGSSNCRPWPCRRPLRARSSLQAQQLDGFSIPAADPQPKHYKLAEAGGELGVRIPLLPARRFGNNCSRSAIGPRLGTAIPQNRANEGSVDRN